MAGGGRGGGAFYPSQAHCAEVEKAVCVAGLTQVISFLGPLDAEAKRSVLLDADLFVLPSFPTYSESFAMAIAEALAHGLPILTTTGAPWSMLPERDCGWRVNSTVDGIAEGLREATSVDSRTLHAMGAKGRELVAAEFGWERVAEQLVSIYENLIACSKLGSSPNSGVRFCDIGVRT